jgi:hypothetical protein
LAASGWSGHNHFTPPQSRGSTMEFARAHHRTIVPRLSSVAQSSPKRGAVQPVLHPPRRGKLRITGAIRCNIASMQRLLLLTLALMLCAVGGFAKGHGSSHAASSVRASGTGSRSSSTSVRGYTTRSGTHVNSYHRTTPDHTQRNNYSTRGNVNPYTGKTGTRTATK